MISLSIFPLVSADVPCGGLRDEPKGSLLQEARSEDKRLFSQVIFSTKSIILPS